MVCVAGDHNYSSSFIRGKWFALWERGVDTVLHYDVYLMVTKLVTIAINFGNCEIDRF